MDREDFKRRGNRIEPFAGCYEEAAPFREITLLLNFVFEPVGEEHSSWVDFQDPLVALVPPIFVYHVPHIQHCLCANARRTSLKIVNLLRDWWNDDTSDL